MKRCNNLREVQSTQLTFYKLLLHFPVREKPQQRHGAPALRMDSEGEEILITWVSWLAINEAFLSAFGITLPSNCGGKKKKPLTKWKRDGAQTGAGRGKAGRLDREAVGSLGAGQEEPHLL